MITTQQLKADFIERAVRSELSVECAMVGPTDARIAFIAEAPGSSEVARDMPLVGASGNILWKSLRQYCPSIRRHEVYVTNVIKRQVAMGAGQRKPVSKNELEAWRALLMWELNQLPNLTTVVLLGNYALQALTGKTGIINWRGSILPLQFGERNLTAIITFNPAFAIHEPLQHIVFDMDINDKLRPVIEGTYTPYNVTTHINPTPRQAIDWIRYCRSRTTPIGGDIEVIANETACVGLAASTIEAMCIAFRNETENVYDENDERQIRHSLQQMLQDRKVRMVWQNGGFDMSWLWFKDRIKCAPAYIDTMLAHHVLYPTMPHDLGFIVKQYTMHPYYKNEKDTWKHTGGVDNFWLYNGKDCALMLASAFKLLDELREQSLYNFTMEHVMRLQAHLVWMTVGGVLSDMELREQMLDEKTPGNLYDDVQRKLRAFHDAVLQCIHEPDYKPNPNSPKQMAELYFTKLRLVGRGTSTDATNRKLMYKHPRTTDDARRVLQAVEDYAKDDKFFSVYASARPDYDCRMRCDWRQTGVQSAPGRLSSAQTLWGSGGNLQNIPDRAKPMFIADDGYVFIYIDGSQAEARVVGWRYNIEKWMAQFERARLDGSYDCHRALAAEMFNVPYDEVPSYDRYPLDEASALRDGIQFVPEKAGQTTIRYTAKRCRHGLNYRMMPDRLALTTGLSIGAASEAFVKYHKITPEIKNGWKADLFRVQNEKAIYNAYGRRYLQLVPLTEDSTEAIVAFFPQSTIGDHTARVIYKAHDDPKWPHGKARIAVNTHDGLVGLVHKDYAKQALRVLVKHAETPIMIDNGKEKLPLIIPAEVGMSVPDATGVHRWSTIKKMKQKEIW